MGSSPAARSNPSRNGRRGDAMDGANRPSRSAKKPPFLLPKGWSGTAVYRCSPHLIPSITELLSERQKGFVRKIGFGSLLSMADFEINKALTMWLVDRFSCDTEALEFGGGVSIPVRPLVKCVLGIPSGPIQVVPGQNVDHALYSQYSCDAKVKKAKEVAEEMCSITEEEPFCTAFMMVILAIYLAPNTTMLVNRSLLGAAQQVGSLKQMDWCGFVADYLFKGIREFKESDAPFVHLKGCVHILSVIFIDHVKHAAFPVPNGFPRLGVVTTEHNKWVASHPFGSLLVRHLEESVYAPVLNNENGNIAQGGKCADSDTNTDALANLPATDNDQNNQHPVSAGPGSLSIAVASETSAQSAGTNHLHGGMSSNPAAHANPSSNGKRGSAMDGGSPPSRSAKKPRKSKSAAYRCSPRLIPPIMELLSEEQKGFVRKIGFGSLLSMADFEMNKPLTLWLVHKFSCDTKALEFGGGVSIPVRPLVKSVLGIPSGPIQVVQGLPIKGKNALYSEYCSVKGKNARKLAEEMCSITEEEPFCIAFMMVILAIYLAPNTTVLVNKSFLGAAQQVGSLKQMDWCGFVADYLFKGIREFKNSDAPFVCLKGCVHILSVIFIDLVKHAAFEVPNGFPRLGIVTTKHNKWVASHPPGSLLVRRLEESVYAPVLTNGNGNIVEGGECADSDTNTDALSNQSATDNDQNSQHPVSACPGSLPIVTGLETSARSAEHIISPRSGEQLQSAGPSSEPCSAQLPNGLEVLAAAAESRNRGSPSTMEKHDRSAKKARVELPESGQVVRAGEATIRMDMSLFSCRVCSHPVKPPVFQCNVGHLACGRCLAELPDEQCQMCEHGGGFSRCPVMDDVVLSSTMKCSYDGCQIYVPYHELSDHQRACPHGPCFCTETGCGFVGVPAALLGHLAALHSVPVHKVHYGSVHQLRVSEPRVLFHAEEDDSAFLLAMDVLGMATVVSVVCIRAGAGGSPEPRYAVKLWVNGPPPPSGAAGSITLDMTAATSSYRPGEVAVEELPAFLMVPPAYLVDCGAYKEVSLHVRIDRM
ncbi:uncharacterized protein LOC123442490 [Hordeum vulgare subsp. vulgare]|uniref:RING-type E3 ubiquitin transferase n=1 Tax=Hordeum vulgare subsp. vulgare TaxID=112509 RepID=A0A8I6XIA5_HORVV|nr:uncharacterized protein LOC123442490 [Hordeum vulgare subsp. vulgare]